MPLWYEYVGWGACAIVAVFLIYTLIWRIRFARQEKAMIEASRQYAEQDSRRPSGFGYKMAWLAILSADPEDVANSLALTGDRDAVDWGTGVAAAYAADIQENVVFVTPPIEGWVFVIGWWRRLDLDSERDAYELTKRLSVQFGRACAFVSYRVSSVYGWMLAEKGSVRRAYLISDGQIDKDEGDIEPVERAWGIDLSDPDDAHRVNEDSVFEVAARWSFDPRLLEDWVQPVPDGLLIRGKKGGN